MQSGQAAFLPLPVPDPTEFSTGKGTHLFPALTPLLGTALFAGTPASWKHKSQGFIAIQAVPQTKPLVGNSRIPPDRAVMDVPHHNPPAWTFPLLLSFH